LTIINYIRGELFNGVKGHLPKSYSLPYPPGTDLRKESFKDFGPLMAFAMSAVDAAYLGFGIALLNRQASFNWYASTLYFLISFGTYYALMMLKPGDNPAVPTGIIFGITLLSLGIAYGLISKSFRKTLHTIAHDKLTPISEYGKGIGLSIGVILFLINSFFP